MFLKLLSLVTKSEKIRISVLIALLALGIVYLLDVDSRGQALMAHLSGGDHTVTLTVLKQRFVGQSIPEITVREAVTQRQDIANVDSYGMLIFISANTCVQQQTGAIVQAQALHETLNGKVPIRLVLLNSSHDEESNRHKALLLRKATRPDFDIWYANDMIPFTKTISDNQLGVVILVENRKISSIFHIGNSNGILHEIGNTETLSSVS
ncbi:MAG: hypothetical protein F4120_10965 [Rhodothermaceae bacterium]|nr:hypothetical protein [Rhodothermaceae bacterium]MYC03962.1 hypothetical protein [Rhodothermaceae bacterium]MYI18120.1 hypothetical protein [Rhodothermaceae bacterium]